MKEKAIDSILFQLVEKLNSAEKKMLHLALPRYGKKESGRANALSRYLSNSSTNLDAFPLSEKYVLFDRMLLLLTDVGPQRAEVFLRKELNRIQVLTDRQLYTEALRKSEAAIEKARQSWCLPDEFRLREVRALLLLNHYKQRVNDVDLSPEFVLLRKMTHMLELRQLVLEMYRIEFREGQPHAPEQEQAFRDLWNGRFATFSEVDLTPPGLLVLHNARGFVMNRLNDIPASVSHYKKSLALYIQYPRLNVDYAMQRLAIHNNLLVVLARQNDATVFYAELDSFRAIESDLVKLRRPELLRRLAIRAIMQELDFLTRQNLFDSATAFVAGKEASITEMLSKTDASERHFIYQKFALLFFQQNDFRQALRWSNRLLDEPENMVRQDMLYSGFIFNLLIHFELENFGLLESRMRNYRKRFSKEPSWAIFRDLIFPVLRKAAYEDDKKQQTKMLVNLLAELMRGGHQNEVLFGDLLLWLNKKQTLLPAS
ncbi:MAG: hypothetical protein ACRCYO_05280 [Bacteroidia bacterium]